VNARRVWPAGLVAMALALAIGLISTHGSAAAATSPGARAIEGTQSRVPPEQVSTETDFCGTSVIDVPDRGAFFDFGQACASHDTCYTAGGTELDRYKCDRDFLVAMTKSCDVMWPKWWDPSQLKNRRNCYSLAQLYYLGVRLGGSTYFNYH
jgi:hypothetical protein